MNPDDLKSAILKALGMTPADPNTAPPSKPSPIYLAAMGRALSPPDKPYSTLTQLTHSPFSDTLHAITGRPSAYTTASYGLTAGEYIGKAPNDSVSLSGLEPDPGIVPRYVQPSAHMNDEWTLSHELGHKYAHAEDKKVQDGGGGLLGYNSRFLDAAHPPEGSGIDDSVPNAYANHNQGEYRAQAFANAVDYLRQTAGLPPTAVGQRRASAMLPKYDAEIPGTSGVVGDLLAKPIYARHPLNMARMAVQPDATAVRKP